MKTFHSLKELAHVVAPETRTRPLYVLWHPSHIPFCPSTVAYCATQSSPAIRQALIRSGEWRGPGLTVVFVHNVPEEDIEGIFLHEVAHGLPLPTEPAVDREPTPEEKQFEARMLEKAKDLPPDDECFRPWWPCHGADFVRRTLHLWSRARAAGCDIPGRKLRIAGSTYALSPPACYWTALGDEAERLAGRTFSEIEETEPPQEFSSLFAADVVKWENDYRARKGKQKDDSSKSDRSRKQIRRQSPVG